MFLEQYDSGTVRYYISTFVIDTFELQRALRTPRYKNNYLLLETRTRSQQGRCHASPGARVLRCCGLQFLDFVFFVAIANGIEKKNNLLRIVIALGSVILQQCQKTVEDSFGVGVLL